MNTYYERQTELLCYLNDNMVQPTDSIKKIVEFFDIFFIDTGEQHGWFLQGVETL